MEKRLKLSEILHEVFPSKNIYFQPPPNKHMSYPCIVYEFANYNTRFADNKPYQLQRQFRFTYVDTNPDSDIPDKLANLPNTIGERSYIRDNLYHYPFRITL